jgi:hypothetical protein
LRKYRVEVRERRVGEKYAVEARQREMVRSIQLEQVSQ